MLSLAEAASAQCEVQMITDLQTTFNSQGLPLSISVTGNTALISGALTESQTAVMLNDIDLYNSSLESCPNAYILNLGGINYYTGSPAPHNASEVYDPTNSARHINKLPGKK
jgi:hypothetical protein